MNTFITVILCLIAWIFVSQFLTRVFLSVFQFESVSDDSFIAMWSLVFLLPLGLIYGLIFMVLRIKRWITYDNSYPIDFDDVVW